MDISVIKRAYEILGKLTPLSSDCGALCEAACCDADEDGQGGVHLFPAEDELLFDEDWCEIKRDRFAKIMVCAGRCPRDKRPLGCRIFPLTPARKEDGSLTVRMDARARAMCPLVRSGVKGVQRDFAKAVLAALREIDKYDDGRDFINGWIAIEEQFRNFRL